jgi:hypothetical protein
MGKVSRVKPHLSLREIQEKIRRTVGFWKVQKWLVIWHATVDPCSAKEIALHTGLAEQTVHTVIALYNRYGPDVVEGKGKGGRREGVFELEGRDPVSETVWKEGRERGNHHGFRD